MLVKEFYMNNTSIIQFLFMLLFFSFCSSVFSSQDNMPAEFTEAIELLYKKQQPEQALIVLESSSNTHLPLYNLLKGESHFFLNEPILAESYYLMPLVTNYPIANLRLGVINFLDIAKPANYHKSLLFLLPIVNGSLSNFDSTYRLFLLAEIYRLGQPSTNVAVDLVKAKQFAESASVNSLLGQGSYLKILLAQAETTTTELQSLYRSINYAILNYPPSDPQILSRNIALYSDWLALLVEKDRSGQFTSLGKLLLSTIKKYERQRHTNSNVLGKDTFVLSPDHGQLHKHFWGKLIQHKNAAYLRVFIQLGFDPLVEIYGSTPMYNWINDEDIDFDDNDIAMMQAIFDEREALDLWTFVMGKKTTLLHLAAHYKRKNLIVFLLNNGFKQHINLRDEAYNLTPLELLLHNVRKLSFEPPYARMVSDDEEDEKPEDLAHRSALVEYLISQGANPNFFSQTSLADISPAFHDLIYRAKEAMECTNASINSLCRASPQSNSSQMSTSNPIEKKLKQTRDKIAISPPIPELIPQVSPFFSLDDFLFNKSEDILVTKHNATLTLWQLSTGYKIRQFDFPDEFIYELNLKGLSDDGRYLYATDYNKILYVWSTYTGKLSEMINPEMEDLRRETKYKGDINNDYYDFSATTNHILVDGYGSVELIDIKGNIIFEIEIDERFSDFIYKSKTPEYSGLKAKYESDVLIAGLSENSQYICLVSETQELSLWNIFNTEPVDVKNFKTELEYLDILLVRVSNQGKYVTLVTEQGLWLWQVEQQKLLQLSSLAIDPFSLSDWSFDYDPNEKYLVKNYNGGLERRVPNKSTIFDLAGSKLIDMPARFGSSSTISFSENDILDLTFSNSILEVEGVTDQGLNIHFVVDKKNGSYELLNEGLLKAYFTLVSDNSRVTNLNLNLNTIANEQLIELHFTDQSYKLSMNELRSLKSPVISQKLELVMRKWNLIERKSEFFQNVTLIGDGFYKPYSYKLNDSTFALMSSDNVYYLDEFDQSNDAHAIIKLQSQFNISPILSNNGEYILFHVSNHLQLWHLPSAKLKWELNLDSLFQEYHFQGTSFQGAVFQDIEFLSGNTEIRLISNPHLFDVYDSSFISLPKSLVISVEDAQVIDFKEYRYQMIDAKGIVGVKFSNNSSEIYALNETPTLLFTTPVDFDEGNNFNYLPHSIETSPNLSTVLIRYKNTQQLWQKEPDGTYQMQFDYKQTDGPFLPDINSSKVAVPISTTDKNLMSKMTFKLSLNGKWLIGRLGSEKYIWRLSDLSLVKVFDTSIIDLDHVWLIEGEEKILVNSTTFDVVANLSDVNELTYSVSSLGINTTNDIIVGVQNNQVFVKKLASESPTLQYTVFKGEQGIDWTWFNSKGYFDSNNLDNINHLVWLFYDQPLTPLAAEVFIRDFYSPGLIGQKENTQTETQRDFNLLNRVLPSVSIENLEYVANTHQAKMKVKVTKKQFKTKSSGAYDLHLLLNGRVVRRSPKASSDQKIELWRQSTMLGAKDDVIVSTEFIVDLPRNTKPPFNFSAYAFNHDRIKSVNAQTKRLHAEQTSYSPILPRAWIVSIGVNDNTNKDLRLSYASSSAYLLGEKLENKLIASNRFSEVIRIPLFTQSQREIIAAISKKEPLNPLPSKLNIKAIIKHLSGAKLSNDETLALANFDGIDNIKIRPDDFLFISYSGHGISDNDENELYLLPYDSAKDILDLYASAISSAELASWLTNLPTEQAVIFLDTCTSGTALDAHEFKPAPLGNAGLGQLAYNKGMAIFVASETGASANAVGISLANLAFILALEKQDSVSTQQQLQTIMKQASKRITTNKVVQKPSLYFFKRKVLTLTSKENL